MRDGIKNQKAMHKLQGKHRNVDARQGQEWERLLRRDKLSDEPQRKGKPHQEDEVVVVVGGILIRRNIGQRLTRACKVEKSHPKDSGDPQKNV